MTPAATLCACEADLVELIRRDAVPIPAYPAVALRLGQLTSTGDFDFRELTDLVSADQAVATAVLRAANAAAFGGGEPVTSLRAAIGRLGARQVAKVALAAGLSPLAEAPGPLAPIRQRLCQASLARAVLCHHLARAQSLAPEEAFAAGLLHDLGKLLATAAVERLLPDHPEALALSSGHWLDLLERYHLELGLVAAARWNLPDALTEVISGHHATPAPPGFVSVVQAADHLVDLLGRLLHVSPAHLAGLPLALDDGARRELAAFLPEVPAFLASFESELASGATPALSRVLDREDATQAPEESGRTLDFPVLVAGRQALSFRARRVTPTHLVMAGRSAMAENYLVQLRLECEDPFLLWGTVKTCRAEPGGFVLEVAPMALNGPTLARWIALVHQAGA